MSVLRQMCRLPIPGQLLVIITRFPSLNPEASVKMLSYDQQLDLKRDTVVEAYKNYSSGSRPHAGSVKQS